MTADGRDRTRPVLVALLWIYLAVLVWLVLWKLHVPYVSANGLGTIKLVPFVRTATAGSSAPTEVWGNVVVFVPFGIYLGLLGRPWWKALAVIATTSAALEITQFVLGVGVTDVTDVIANTAGGLVGLVLIAVIGRGRATRHALGGLCVAATAAALLVLFLYLAVRAGPMPLL